MSEYITPATKFVDIVGPIEMRRGGVLAQARIAYEDWGRPTPTADNVVVILTGLSPNAHAAATAADPGTGWWEDMLGPGKPIDTDRWFVICLNPLGSCHGSTGPASTDPSTGTTFGLRFPDLSVEDIADTAASAIRALSVRSIACLIGNSMGGMVALALLARHPGLVRSHVSISSAVQALPFSIAVRSIQREAIRSDPLWNDGAYDELGYPEDGMMRARKLGIMTYRSAGEWDLRFARRRTKPSDRGPRDQFGAEYEIESYLNHHARRFARSYDPNCFLYLSRSIDRFDLGEMLGCGPDAALSRLALRSALVIGTRSDLLFPLHQQEQIALGLERGGAETTFLPLDSLQGHDAFLTDLARFGPPIRAFLARERVPRDDFRADPRPHPCRDLKRTAPSGTGRASIRSTHDGVAK